MSFFPILTLQHPFATSWPSSSTGKGSRDFQVAVAPLQITFACHLKGTQEFVPMKRSYHFYSYHSGDLAAYHGQPTKRKALLNFSFPLEGKCHEVAKGCTRARMIMLLPLLPYAGPTSADLEVLCRTSTATLIRLRRTFPYAGDRISLSMLTFKIIWHTAQHP